MAKWMRDTWLTFNVGVDTVRQKYPGSFFCYLLVFRFYFLCNLFWRMGSRRWWWRKTKRQTRCSLQVWRGAYRTKADGTDEDLLCARNKTRSDLTHSWILFLQKTDYSPKKTVIGFDLSMSLWLLTLHDYHVCVKSWSVSTHICI